MKKIYKYLALVILSASLTACDTSFLERTDPDKYDESLFYKTEQEIEEVLVGAYQGTRGFYNWMFFATEMKSDNASTTNTGDSGGLYSTFTNHIVSPHNTIVTNIWNSLFFTIHRSNLVLKHVENVEMSVESRARIKAEAKFLRALSHFYLVRLYGPVPAMRGLVTTVSESKALTREPLNVVYDFIIEDLKEVSECQYLGTFEAGNRQGRATSTAGAALLGKVYLTRAATLGETEHYDNAITYLKKACELHKITELPTNFNTVFGVGNSTNSEIIYQCMYLGTQEQYSPFATYFGPYGAKGLTSNINGRGFNSGEKNLYEEFESRDRRSVATMSATATKDIYYTKKYVDLSNNSGYNGNCWIELRFADVFLMLAEAYERVGESDNAIKYLDLVRTKHGSLSGYNETIQTNVDYATKYPTLRDAIFHERRVELAFENHRWFDLLRLYPNAEDLASYMRSKGNSLKYVGFQAYEVLLPIPADEVDYNSNIYQNKGY